jgi:cyclic pyranopterin phosphate synthase
VACSSIQVTEAIYQAIHQGTLKKGDVLAVAQVAGIMAAKNTAQLIPMCHPLMLSGVDLSFSWNLEEGYQLTIEATVKNKGETGVEMEALTAAVTAALTVYDMCKALDKGMVIGPTYLLHKSGGKSDDYRRP